MDRYRKGDTNVRVRLGLAVLTIVTASCSITSVLHDMPSRIERPVSPVEHTIDSLTAIKNLTRADQASQAP